MHAGFLWGNLKERYELGRPRRRKKKNRKCFLKICEQGAWN